MERNYITRWLARHLAGIEVEQGPQTCSLCGGRCAEGQKVHEIMRNTFTDWHVFRADSRLLCAACSWYIDHSVEIRRAPGWIVSESKAEVWPRPQMGTIISARLSEPLDEDCYYLIATSKRKHLSLYAPLTAANSHILRLQFEMITVDVEPEWWFDLSGAYTALRMYHSREEILTDLYREINLRQWWPDLNAFERRRNVVHPWLGSAQLDLVAYCFGLPPKKKERENGSEAVG